MSVYVDLGRSHVRVVGDSVDVRGDHGAGLGDAGGPLAAARLVAAAARDTVPGPIDRIAVCAPGVVTAPELARQFADRLAAALDAETTVVSDSAAWQAGAFAGADGAVVALGTGAVVVARHDDTITRLDGLGLLLGDVGGGAWIGLQALRYAIRTPGRLREDMIVRFGPTSGWSRLLGDPALATVLARCVPGVVAAADGGDAAAVRVLDDAAAGIAQTLGALPADLPTCAVGGIAAVVGPRLRRVSERRWVEPAGDAIDGLRVLQDDPGTFAGEVFRGTPGRRVNGHDTRPGHDTDHLPTEAVAPDTADLDTWPTERLVGRLAAGHAGAAQAVVDAAAPLARAADLAGAALSGTGRLVYVGAGTPGRLAVQDAAELTPTYALPPDRAVVLLAGGATAGSRAVEGAEDDTASATADVDRIGIGPDDVVVGVSASGRTPYVLAALRRAAERGAPTVGICNVPDSPLAAEAGIAVELLTGPEVIAGSTRLAAGTAQKIALNTLSTAAMVRAGATYGPWMVDMLATNDKLRRRAVRIVQEATGVAEPVAGKTLAAAEGSVPVALVMTLAGVDRDEARRRLESHGSVRAAVSR